MKTLPKWKAVIVASAMLMAQSAMAQDIPALNANDYTKPA